MTTAKVLNEYFAVEHKMSGPRFYSKYEDSGEFHLLVRADNVAAAEELATGLYYSRCGCAHDCCGHYQRYVLSSDIVKVGRKQYRVPVYFSRNI